MWRPPARWVLLWGECVCVGAWCAPCRWCAAWAWRPRGCTGPGCGSPFTVICVHFIAHLPLTYPKCLQVVRRIDVAAKGVYWSEGGGYAVIAGESSFFMLEYMRDEVESFLASGQVRAA